MPAYKRRLFRIVAPLIVCGVLLFACYQVVETISLNALYCSEGKINSANLDGFNYGTIPSDATNIDEYQTKRCTILLRFDIDVSEQDSFLASTRIKTPLIAKKDLKDPSTFTVNDLWTLDPTKTYLYGRGPVSLDYTQTVFVDQSQAERDTIYLIVDRGD